MSNPILTIWSNTHFEPAVTAALEKGVKPHRLVFSSQRSASILAGGAPDAALAEADVAFGQPDPQSLLQSPRVRWVQLTTAGYTRYDTAEFRAAFSARGARLSNSSHVYDEPCAEHAAAFVLAHARQLPQSWEEQRTDRKWSGARFRSGARLLKGQRIVLLGFGAIGVRLVELLAPFGLEITAVRRSVTGKEPVRAVGENQLAEALATADHVISLLPENAETRGYMSADRFAQMKPGTVFYNIGRGTTVDQRALLDSLNSGALAAAYLDVTDPEPLPPDHPLWSAPNCFITPHTAGGFAEEETALVQHFLANLRRFTAGESLVGQVI